MGLKKIQKSVACPEIDTSKDFTTPAKRHLYSPMGYMTNMELFQPNKGYQDNGTPDLTRNSLNQANKTTANRKSLPSF